MARSLLQDALLLDTESLGLQRGSGLHELAVYDVQSRSVHEFILTPNLVHVASAIQQENTRLATSSADTAVLLQEPRWLDVIKRGLQIEGQVGADASDQEVVDALKQVNPWLHKSLNKYPHLMGNTSSLADQSRRLELLRKRGNVGSFSSKVIDPADLIKSGGDLEELIRGKTVWLANAAFDAKQIGALVSGLETQGIPSSLKATMQTAGPGADPFYVTGVAVNQARVTAQQTGDWTGVWRAYMADMPAAGETAVRDVQDILRSMMSYGQKLGLTGAGDVYWGTSLDLVHRLMGSLEKGSAGKELLLAAESHRAVEDNAIHLQHVLNKTVEWTEALQHVTEKTARGKELLKQAKDQHGPLYEVAAFLKRQEMLKPEIQRVNLIKRLGRAHQDILEQGSTWQVDGWRAVTQMSQTTPSGESVKVPFLQPNRVQIGSMEEMVSFLNSTGKYGEEMDVAGEALAVTHATDSGEGLAAKKRLLAQYLDTRTSSALEERIALTSEKIVGTFNQEIGKSVSRAERAGNSIGRAAEALSYAKVPALLKNWGAFAGAVAGAGLVWSMASGNADATRGAPSLVTYDYATWLKHQAEFTNSRGVDEQREGMSDRGLMGARRSRYTDFGSPYQGMLGSQAVFDHQKLLDEREKWLRQQYGAIHYNPANELFGLQGIAARNSHSGYSFLPGGTPVGNGYQSLNGKHLMRVNLGDGSWKINVEDADTITLKRGGIRGAVSSIFGLNKGYSFRLAGVDSPEVTHAGQLSGGQPQGETSLKGLKALLGESTELVFDPTQTTYGRTMGVFFAGGKNVNYELVKRGLAAHLPYGKAEDSIIDYSIMKGMETGASRMSRGMWQHPYWKTLYDVTAGHDRPTFNTLTKPEKLVENTSAMQTLSLMEQAEANGQYSAAMASEASMMARSWKTGVDSVKPFITGQTASHYDSYLHQMQTETQDWMDNKGTRQRSSLSSRDGYGRLDKALTIDSLSQTNSIWSRRRLQAFDRYHTGAASRRERQVAAQQQVNQTIFQSQINHTRM